MGPRYPSGGCHCNPGDAVVPGASSGNLKKGLQVYCGHRVKPEMGNGWMWETSKDKEELSLDQGVSRGGKEKRVDSEVILKVESLYSGDG